MIVRTVAAMLAANFKIRSDASYAAGPVEIRLDGHERVALVGDQKVVFGDREITLKNITAAKAAAQEVAEWLVELS